MEVELIMGIDGYLQQTFSIENLYLNELQKKNFQSWQTMFLSEKQLSSILIFERPEDEDSDNDIALASKALNTAYLMFLGHGDFERGHLILRGLQTIMKEFSSSEVKKYTGFEIFRARGLGFYKESKYAAALKELNAAIASCPKVNGSFADGLSDALVILSESYALLEKTDDALHSARLAVDTGHERLSRAQNGLRSQASPVTGPMLDPLMGTVVSYCTLAIVLERSSLSNLSIEWYQRAYQTAVRFNFSDDMTSLLKKQIQRLQPIAFEEPVNPFLSPPHKHIRHSNFEDEDQIIDLDSDGPWFVPAKKSHNYSDEAAPASQTKPNFSPQIHVETSRMRPHSALPILNRGKHGDYDEDDRVMENSFEAKLNDTISRGSPRNLDQEYLHTEFGRPKSALSKLGGRYNETPKRTNESMNRGFSREPAPIASQFSNRKPPNLTQTPFDRDVSLQGPQVQSEELIANFTDMPKTSKSSSKKPTLFTPKTSREVHSIVLIPTSYISDIDATSDGSQNISSQQMKPRAKSAAPVESKYLLPSTRKDQEVVASKRKPIPVHRGKEFPKKKLDNAKPESLLKSSSHPALGKKTIEASFGEDPSSITRSKTNKTMLSKTLSSAYLTVGNYNNGVPNTALKPHAPTAVQNWLQTIDEFGKEKVKRVSDMYLPYFKGLRVEAKYQMQRLGDRGKWYPGRIMRADFLNGLYDIEFENGDKEKNIFVDDIRIPEYASKLALVKATHANNRQKEASSRPKNQSLISAHVRDQNMEAMHNSMLRIVAGVNQRSDMRKLERLNLKSSKIVRVQSLVRGVLTRLHFPKIRAQISRERELRQLEKELKAKEEAIVRFTAQIMDDHIVMNDVKSDNIPEQIAMAIQTDDLLWMEMPETSLNGTFDNNESRITYDKPIDFIVDADHSFNKELKDADIQVSESSLVLLTHNDTMLEHSHRIFQALEADQSLAMIQNMLLTLKDQQNRLIEFESINQENIHSQLYTLQSQIIHQRDEFHQLRLTEDSKRQDMVMEIKGLIERLEDDLKARQEEEKLLPHIAVSSPVVHRHMNKELEELSISMPKEASQSLAEDFIQSVSSNDIPNFIRSLASVEEHMKNMRQPLPPPEQLLEAKDTPPKTVENKAFVLPYEGDVVPAHIERYMPTHDFGDLLDSEKQSQSASEELPDVVTKEDLVTYTAESSTQDAPAPIQRYTSTHDFGDLSDSAKLSQSASVELLDVAVKEESATYAAESSTPSLPDQKPIVEHASIAIQSVDLSLEVDVVMKEEDKGDVLLLGEDEEIDVASAAPYLEESIPIFPPELTPHKAIDGSRSFGREPLDSPLNSSRQPEQTYLGESMDGIPLMFEPQLDNNNTVEMAEVKLSREDEILKMEVLVDESTTLDQDITTFDIKHTLPSANDLSDILSASAMKKTRVSDALQLLEVQVEDVLKKKKTLAVDREIDNLESKIPELSPYAITLLAPAHSSPIMICNEDIIIPIESITINEKVKMIFLLPDVISHNPDNVFVVLKLYDHSSSEKQSLSMDSVPVSSEVLLEVTLRPKDLMKMFEQHKWQSFANKSVQCSMRGSLVRVDHVLKLIVDLWEAYLLWMVQSIKLTVHVTKTASALIVALKSPDRTMSPEELDFHTRSFQLRQLAFGEDEEDEIDLGVVETVQDEEEKEIQQNSAHTVVSKNEQEFLLKYLDGLKVGRGMFIKSIKELYALEKDFEQELESWEFDIRCYNKINTCSSNGEEYQDYLSVQDELEESQYAEIALSSGLQDLTNRMHKFISLKLLDHRPHFKSQYDPLQETANLSESMLGDKLQLDKDRLDSLQECRDRWSGKWQKALHEVIYRFLQSLGLLELVYSKPHLFDYATQCCALLFTMTMNLLEEEDWIKYWGHRDRCVQLIHQSGLDRVLQSAEDLMYAPVYTTIESIMSREGRSIISTKASMSFGSRKYGGVSMGSFLTTEKNKTMESQALPDTADFVKMLREVAVHLT